MLDFLPIGTNLSMKSPEGPVLDGITLVHNHAAWGMSFSVAPVEGRPERQEITGPHLLGYYNKYVARWHGGKGFWDSLHNLLSVKAGPYAGLTLNEVKVAGPERDRSKAFLLDWGIPQGASFHVKYPGDAPESEPCNFFLTGEDGAGFAPSDVSRLISGEKLVALYCERFGLPNVRDPYSLIIWRQGEFKGMSLRASKARLDAELEGRQRAALHLSAPKRIPDAYDIAWAKARTQVEVERKALAEELERKAADEAREAEADAIFAEEARAAPASAPPVAPAKPSVAEAKALLQAKEVALLQELENLEGLKAAQERIKTLESRIVELKGELNIQ
jgi:hypothetical protein